ncbi:MAG TPA: DUF2336 domain-containing protein [Xanthobacteraceae bacterium]|nr:DUF2336 domain-containing protein [Xanthobacteraceae bacterium]
MSDPDSAASDLRARIDAARSAGLDTRPLLLHALVARLGDARELSPAEQARFTTLAIRLFDAVEPSVAAEQAEALAPRPHTPYALAFHLARGPIDLAEPVLRLSPVLDEVTLMALAETTSPAHRTAIAARRDVPPALAKRLAAAAYQAREARRPAAPARYFEAGPAERAAMLDALDALPPLPLGERVPRAGSAVLERLAQAAERGQTSALAEMLARPLAISDDIAARILADPGGEALLVAGRVLGLPFELVGRLLAALDPAIGESVSRMFALAELYERLPEASAQHLVAAWRAAPRRPTARPTEDAPSTRSFGLPRRGATATDDAAERRRRG